MTFEKLGAIVFLVLMLGLVAFLTFIPMPLSSEKVILIIIGGLMTESAKGVGKLVGGGEDPEKNEMRARIRELEQKQAITNAALETLREEHRLLTRQLLRHHVLYDEAEDKTRPPMDAVTAYSEEGGIK